MVEQIHEERECLNSGGRAEGAEDTAADLTLSPVHAAAGRAGTIYACSAALHNDWCQCQRREPAHVHVVEMHFHCMARRELNAARCVAQGFKAAPVTKILIRGVDKPHRVVVAGNPPARIIEPAGGIAQNLVELGQQHGRAVGVVASE